MICPVNRPEYEQGLPGSNRRQRFWRPLCFRLHQAPLNIPDKAHEIQWISVLRRPKRSGDLEPAASCSLSTVCIIAGQGILFALRFLPNFSIRTSPFSSSDRDSNSSYE